MYLFFYLFFYLDIEEICRMPPRGKSTLNTHIILKALREVSATGLSYRKAAAKYNVSQSSLMKYERVVSTSNSRKRKLARNTINKSSGIFTDDEELMLLEILLALVDSDVLLNDSIIELVVQAYLTYNKRQIEHFKEGTIPTNQWLNYFIIRYKMQLSAMMWTKSRSTDGLFRLFANLEDIYDDKLILSRKIKDETDL